MPKNSRTLPSARDRARPDSRIDELESAIRKLYTSVKDLPFHGWHHIYFVKKKAEQFARERGANPLLVAVASLVHDLNYMVRPNSAPEAGRQLHQEYLANAGFARPDIDRVEEIINEAHTATRTQRISPEGAALSAMPWALGIWAG